MNDYSFGNRITKLRNKLDLSQAELGTMVGVTNKAVSKWENGVAKPGVEVLAKLSSIFGITIDELLKEEDNSNITKIVITGGPCAGKSSAKSWVESEFTKLGYTVIFVSETATEMMCSGIKPMLINNTYEFQKMIFEYQTYKENLAIEAAKKMKDKKILIIFDRGVIDNKAYTTAAEFNKLLMEENTNITEVRDRYDAVIHLVTAAKGAREYYTLANNEARFETPDQAAESDTKTINAYVGHPHLRVIDNSTDFKTKMVRLVREIASFLGEPVPYEIERKFLIKMPNIEKLEKMPNCAKSEIIQTYLKSSDNEETRIRQRGIDGNYSYTKTTKIDVTGMKRVEKEQRLSKDEYIRLLMNADPNFRQIRKTRYCLCYDNHYYEIDIFPFMKDEAIMEVELINEEEEFKIPKFIEVIKEVTDDENYKNHNLAKIK